LNIWEKFFSSPVKLAKTGVRQLYPWATIW